MQKPLVTLVRRVMAGSRTALRVGVSNIFFVFLVAKELVFQTAGGQTAARAKIVKWPLGL